MSAFAAMPRRRGLREIGWLSAGFVIWSAAFVVLYGGLSVLCWLGWGEMRVGPIGVARLVLLGGWLAFSGLCAGLVALAVRRAGAAPGGATPLDRAVVLSAVASLVSTVWLGLPIVGTSVCT